MKIPVRSNPLFLREKKTPPIHYSIFISSDRLSIDVINRCIKIIIMLSDYTFLTDHSYSLRPVVDDNDELPLEKREEKNKKARRSSNRTRMN